MAQPPMQRRGLSAGDGAERIGGLQLQRAADCRLHQREVPDHEAEPASPTTTRGCWATHAADRSNASAVPSTSNGNVASKRRPPKAAPPHQSWTAPLRKTMSPDCQRRHGGQPIPTPQQQQSEGADIQDRRHREQAVARRPEHLVPMRIPQTNLRADRRDREPGAVDRFPCEHLRQQSDDSQRDKQQAVPHVSSSSRRDRNRQWPIAVTDHSMAGSSTKSTFCHRIAPITPASSPSAAHCPGVRPPRVAAQSHVKIATAAIDGACAIDGSFTRYQRMNEPSATTADGQCRPPGRRVDPRQAIAEEQAHQTPEQPGDADGLPVRIRRAVGGHGVPARGQRVRDPIADGEKRRPRQARPDRPRRLGMAGRCGREQMRLVAEPEQAIVVGQIVVAVEPQRSQVREVVEPVTLQRAPSRSCATIPAENASTSTAATARSACHAPVACRAHNAAAVAATATISTLDGSRACRDAASHDARAMDRPARSTPHRAANASGAPIARRLLDHRSACLRGLADGSRSSRTKNGPVRTRPKIHTSSVISAVTPLSA